MTKNNGRSYEEFVQFILKLRYAEDFNKIELQTNHLLNGREFDIYWEEQRLGLVTKYAIECKDYRKNVSIDKIEAFITKLKDNNINKGIFVTKTGFQKGCFEKAKKHGIDLLIIGEFTPLKQVNITLNCISQIPRETISSTIIADPKYHNILTELHSLPYYEALLFMTIIDKDIVFDNRVINYIERIINTTKNLKEKEYNYIEEDFISTNKKAFIYKLNKPNTKIPIKGISIKYIFDYSKDTTELVVKNDNNFYDKIVGIFTQINLDNPKNSTSIYVRNDITLN